MAKKSMIAKANRTPKFKVRGYHRCTVCGRPRAFIRRFALWGIGSSGRISIANFQGKRQCVAASSPLVNWPKDR